MTLKLVVVLNWGVPLSVTRTVTVLVPVCALVGVQLNAPDEAPIVALCGAASKL
jgi:hypothetical protein